MISATNIATGNTAAYTYDPAGQRIKMVVQNSDNSSTTTYYPTKYYNISYTTDGKGNKSPAVITKHIFANDINIATIKGSGADAKIYYNHSDLLNSSSLMTDSTGAVVETMDYFPFGGIRLDKSAPPAGGAESPAFSEQRKFIGQEFDPETGLNYLNARYYNSSIGRFISQDSVHLALGDAGQTQQLTGQSQEEILQDPQQLNSYSYARNNPIIYTDQQGDFAFLIPALIYATPSIIAAGAFVAAQSAFVGMIGNAFTQRPAESSVRMAPIVGDLIDAGEAVSGRDAFSGNSLSWSDRAVSGLAASLPFVAGGMVRRFKNHFY